VLLYKDRARVFEALLLRRPIVTFYPNYDVDYFHIRSINGTD